MWRRRLCVELRPRRRETISFVIAYATNTGNKESEYRLATAAMLIAIKSPVEIVKQALPRLQNRDATHVVYHCVCSNLCTFSLSFMP